VEKHRPITEDDIYLTELLIARSYGNLKQSVVQASSDAFGSVGESIGGTVRKHPCATAGAAIGAGIILFGLFRMMNRGGSSREKRGSDREKRSRTDMTTEIFSMLMPIITPYVTAYLKKYLGRVFSKDQN
jgi:hypothetical protein